MPRFWEEDGPVSVENFIGGNFVKAADYIDSFDPSTGKPWAKIPDSDTTDVTEAVASAQEAFVRYSISSVNNTQQCLHPCPLVLGGLKCLPCRELNYSTELET